MTVTGFGINLRKFIADEMQRCGYKLIDPGCPCSGWVLSLFHSSREIMSIHYDDDNLSIYSSYSRNGFVPINISNPNFTDDIYYELLNAEIIYLLKQASPASISARRHIDL
jgi:hypothetical protein